MPKIRAGELTMYFELEGPVGGPPLVFIGGLGNTHTIWANQTPEFSQHYLTLTFDNRDCGLTDESPSSHYYISDMARDTVDLMTAVGIEKAHIVGYSMGGAIAQEIALGWQDKVATLTLIATFAKVDTWGAQLFQKFGPLDQSGIEQEIFKFISPFAFNWRNFQQTSFVSGMRNILSGRPDYQPTPGFTRQLSAVIDHDTFLRLPNIKVPTLVIAGERDLAAPANHLLKISEAIPGAKFHLIKSATHQIPQNFSAELNQTLAFFLLDHPVTESKEQGAEVREQP
jgi:3-oxoadipate enol-lactonase